MSFTLRTLSYFRLYRIFFTEMKIQSKFNNMEETLKYPEIERRMKCNKFSRFQCLILLLGTYHKLRNVNAGKGVSEQNLFQLNFHGFATWRGGVC